MESNSAKKMISNVSNNVITFLAIMMTWIVGRQVLFIAVSSIANGMIGNASLKKAFIPLIVEILSKHKHITVSRTPFIVIANKLMKSVGCKLRDGPQDNALKILNASNNFINSQIVRMMILSVGKNYTLPISAKQVILVV